MQWVKGLETLYAHGCRAFVEVGPKKALKGFVDDVLGDKGDVVSLFTNHPKWGEISTFNQALCGLYAAGYGVVEEEVRSGDFSRPVASLSASALDSRHPVSTPALIPPAPQPAETTPMSQPTLSADSLAQLAQALQLTLTNSNPQPATRNPTTATNLLSARSLSAARAWDCPAPRNR